MAEDKSQEEKTEEPTPQRREDFRKQGQVAQTRELSSALVLFGVAMLIWLLGRFYMQQVFATYNTLYGSHFLEVLKTGNIFPAISFAFKQMFVFIGPVLFILFFIAIASTVFQIGILFTSEPLTPNLNKINPVEGLKRVFSMKSLVEGMKAIFKFSLVSIVIFMVFKSEYRVIPQLLFFGPLQTLAYVGTLLFKTMLSISAVMAILAGFDYLFQRFDLEKQMRMTKQEVKEELKSREGDPLIKARIRKIQKEMATKRMMEDVPKADVIITNPTHLAIALKYDPENFAAPVVLAKGSDFMAQKIRELAKEHEIPIVENKPLARTIYKTIEIGQVIPRELFAAVAEVLAYVFKLKRKRKING